MEKIKVPFDKHGNQMAYPFPGTVHEWRKNYEFEAGLFIVAYDRGRRSFNLILEDRHGVRYSMFAPDAFEMLTGTSISHGLVWGKWTFCKRGPHYGLVWSKQ